MDPGHSQSLERGLAILSAFEPSRSLRGVSDLAREIGLSRSTTHRYVATLASLGYLQQDAATRTYRLGPKVLDLGFSALNSMELREISAPHLQQLSDETGFTASLGILDGTDVVLIERVRSTGPTRHQVELSLHVGSRLPCYCTATGKALLAHLPADRLEEVLDGVELLHRGPNTITTREALAAELARVRSTGLAVNDEELAYALRAIAAPVRSRSAEVVAAVNLSVPRSTSSVRQFVAELGPMLTSAAGDISARLG